MTIPFTTHPPFEVTIPFIGETDPGKTWAYNVPQVLSVPSARQRSAFVTALSKVAFDLSPDARWTVGKGVSHPELDTPMLGKGIGVAERCAGDSTLKLLTTKVDLAALIVLDQPRGAETPPGISGPKVRGVIDVGGKPLPQLVYEFTSWDAVESYIAHTVEVTMDKGQHLAPSILTSKVSKPILIAVATIRITGDPGSDQPIEEIHVLVVLDGNTRVVCSLQAAFGGQFSRKQLPAEIARRMLRKAKSTAGELSAQHQRGRAEAHAEALDRFNRAAGDTTNPELVRFGQTASISAEMIIGYHRFAGPLAMREFEFVDAVRSDVGQQHSLARAWPDGSVTANVGQQAIARAVASGVLSEEVGAIAEGSLKFGPRVTLIPDSLAEDSATEDSPPTQTPESTLDVGLARAVYLLHALTQPAACEEMKRNIRALGGHKKVDRNLYGRHIAAALWRDWAPNKEVSHDNEAVAWRVGGALVTTPPKLGGDGSSSGEGKGEKTTDAVFGKRWEALFPPRWADLVPIALDTEDPRHSDARLTLQVAGGLALIADGLLLAGSGSTRFGLQGQEYIRRHPATVLALLGSKALGLWTLAHAADSFRSGREAGNAYSVGKAIPSGVYSVAFPKSGEEPSIPVTSDNGVYQNYDRLRDLAGLRKALKGVGGQKAKPAVRSVSEQLEDRVTELRNAINDALDAQRGMEALISTSPGLAGKAFADTDDWNSVQNELMDVYTAVRSWRPAHPVDSVIDDDDDQDDEILADGYTEDLEDLEDLEELDA